MDDYTLSLTAEELDELEKCIKSEERISFTWLMDHGKEKGSRKMAEQNKLQNRIIGRVMDARRKASEICPDRDPDNPLLPRRDNSGEAERFFGKAGGEDAGDPG